MNALDALFSRQVPTKAPGPSASAAGRDVPADQQGSFASALSGRSSKPETGNRQSDSKVAASDETVAEPTDAEEVPEEDTGTEKPVDILELLGQRLAKTDDEVDPDAKSEDEIVVDDEPVEEEDAILLEEAPVVAQTPVAPVAEGEGEADAELAAAAVAAQPTAAVAQADRTTKGEQPHAANGAGAARSAAVEGNLQDQGKASADTGDQAASEQQARGKPDLAALDASAGSVSASSRGEGDAAIEGVEVLDRRSVAAPSMSQNGENVAKALFREASGMTTGQVAEHAEARATAATERANAAFMARGPGQTLQTLRIQLNPESLGQVTATMRLSGGELQVELKVQNADAYRQLSDDSSSIAKALRAHGFGVDQITVQHTGGADRGNMNQQQGQNSSQQFQFRDGLAQNAGGGNANGNGGSRREQAAGGGQNLGELGHEAVSGTAGSSGRSDGVYL